LHTPIGDITVSEEVGNIVAVDWGWGRDQTETPLLRRAREQLHAYFDGGLREFDLPLAPAGTAYRRRVWQALCAIPFGETRSYIDIALAAGGSARAVGQANGCNPIPIIIPCHRVVHAPGRLTRGATTRLGGYSGGEGVATKRYLLALEARAQPLFQPIPSAAA
jgi:methylated-DNA-[protein]-cysteine S-methyltransferase